MKWTIFVTHFLFFSGEVVKWNLRKTGEKPAEPVGISDFFTTSVPPVPPFGSGFLISEAKVAERAAAERARTIEQTVWELSEAERRILDELK